MRSISSLIISFIPLPEAISSFVNLESASWQNVPSSVCSSLNSFLGISFKPYLAKCLNGHLLKLSSWVMPHLNGLPYSFAASSPPNISGDTDGKSALSRAHSLSEYPCVLLKSE